MKTQMSHLPRHMSGGCLDAWSDKAMWLPGLCSTLTGREDMVVNRVAIFGLVENLPMIALLCAMTTGRLSIK